MLEPGDAFCTAQEKLTRVYRKYLPDLASWFLI